MKNLFKASSSLVTAVIGTLIVLSIACPARAAFKVTAPKTWQRQDIDAQTGFHGAIYKNTQSKRNELVVIGSFDLRTDDQSFQRELGSHQKNIQAARAGLFKELGLAGFTILDIEKRRLRTGEFSYMQVMQSMFRDLSGREVQMIERQYVHGAKMFVVTYLIDAAAIGDRARVEIVLDGFQPVARATRMPASANETLVDKPATTDAAADDAPVTALRDLDMTKTENQKRCEAVPAEKRRTPLDRSLFGQTVGAVKDLAGGGWGCVKGVANGAIDFAVGTVKMVYETGKFAAKYSWSWATGNEYKDQVHASVGSVISQLVKDPAALGSKIAHALGEAAAKYAGEFYYCLSTEAQMEAICNLATQLNPKLLISLAAKAPLAVNEMSALIKSIDQAFAAERRIVKAKAELAPVKEILPYGTAEKTVAEPLFRKLVNAQVKHEEIAPQLSKLSDDEYAALLTNRNPVIRQNAGKSILDRDPEFVTKFANKPGQSVEFQRDAVRALDKSRSPEARAALITALKSDDNEVRLLAAKALTKFRDPETAQILLAMSGDFVPEIRAIAAEQSVFQASYKAANELFGHATDGELAAALQGGDTRKVGLAQLLLPERSPEFQNWAITHAGDESLQASNAQALLARSSDLALQERVLRSPSTAVVKQGVLSANVYDPKAMKLVEDLALNHKDEGVKEAARERLNLALAMRLPSDPAMKARQASWLLSLREIKETEGVFRNEEQKKMYEILQLRNESLGLIASDLDGQAFVAASAKFDGLKRLEKHEWIRKFGFSQHTSADATILEKLYKEQDRSVQWALSEVALRRGLKVDYQKLGNDYMTALRNQLMMEPGKDGKLLGKLDALNINEGYLRPMIEKQSGWLARNAAEGLRGRRPRFAQLFAEHADPQVRLAVVKALEGHFDGMAKKALLKLAKDGDAGVARAANELLSKFEGLSATSWLVASTDDAEARLAVAKKLLEGSVVRDRVAVERLLTDPVDEIRKVGVELLGRESDLSWNRARLKTVFEKDGEIEVRKAAKSHLDSVTGDVTSHQGGRAAKLAEMRAENEKKIGPAKVADKDVPLLFLMRHVYDAVEYKAGQTAQQMVRGIVDFISNTPLGYKVIDQMGGPLSGYKAALYRGQKDVVLAIGGTETMSDAVTNLNLGIAQAKSLAFRRSVERTVSEALATNSQIVVTGHSLGGGEAQMAGHEIIKLLQEKGIKDAAQRVRVVTWNAFGAVEPLERMEKFDPKIAKAMSSTNYYVPKEDVHRIGTHIGTMHELPELDMGRFGSHLRAALVESVIFKNGLQRGVTMTPGKVPGSTLATALIGPIAERLQKMHFENLKAKRVIQSYLEARVLYAAEHEYGTLKPAFDWLKVDIEDAIATSGENKAELTKLFEEAEKAREKILREKRAVSTDRANGGPWSNWTESASK